MNVDYYILLGHQREHFSASYLDLLLSIGRDGQLHTSIYDKRDDFNFHITNLPLLSSNIPSSPAYGVFYLSTYTIRPGLLLVWMFYSEGQATFQEATQTGIPCGTLEIVIQEVLWSIRGSCWAIWSNPLTNVKWHSDPWPTVTSLPITPVRARGVKSRMCTSVSPAWS